LIDKLVLAGLMGVGLADSGWSDTDFVVASVAKKLPFDPWSPEVSSLHAKSVASRNDSITADAAETIIVSDNVVTFEPVATPHIEKIVSRAVTHERVARAPEIFDFWNPTFEQKSEQTQEITAEDWARLDLPLFDPDRVVNPFVVPSRSDSLEEIASKRARWLLNLLGVSKLRRRTFMRFFENLFDDYPAAQTFAALASLVEDGISVDGLRTACEFRVRFLAESKWRLVRSRSKLSTAQPAMSDGIMGWARAAKWVNLCKGDDPSVYLDDTWVEDWYDLPPNSPDRWVFADYAEQRLVMIWNDVLEIDFDSTLRWVPSEVRQHHLPTSQRLRSRLGQLALSVTGTLRKEKPKK
jgi:hypothetical protein